MNWVDAVIVLVLALYGLIGWRRGFLAIMTGLVVLAVSIALAALLYKPLTPVLQGLGLSRNFAQAAAFLGVWLVAQIGLTVLAARLHRRIGRAPHRSRLNKTAGVIPGILEGLILVAFVLLLLIALPSPAIPKEDILNSTIARPMIRAASTAERYAANVFGGAIRDALSFLTIEPEPTSRERIDLPFRTTNVRPDPQAERRMLVLINRERRERGLNPLVADPEIRSVARDHSRDMFAQGYFSHVNLDDETPFQRMRGGGVRFGAAGENLAFAPTVEIAHSGLMDSPGHRENILSPSYRRAGIGAIKSDAYGTMFTQNFAD